MQTARSRPPKYYFPDEEPEERWLDWATWVQGGLCTFCGHADHVRRDCPVKPL